MKSSFSKWRTCDISPNAFSSTGLRVVQKEKKSRHGIRLLRAGVVRSLLNQRISYHPLASSGGRVNSGDARLYFRALPEIFANVLLPRSGRTFAPRRAGAHFFVARARAGPAAGMVRANHGGG